MATDRSKCPLCLSTAGVSVLRDSSEKIRVQCPRCGAYRMTWEAESVLGDSDMQSVLYLLSGVTRRAWEQDQPLYIQKDRIDELISVARPPQDIFDSVDRLMQIAKARMTPYSDEVVLSANDDYPLLFAPNSRSFASVVQRCDSLNLIESRGGEGKYRFTGEGWEYAKRLHVAEPGIRNAFVAMWFDETLKDAWLEGFYPALDDLGMEPIRVDLHEHNDKIDDYVISSIRDSGLLIADFTGCRPNVYFEAGFAMGLARTVIWSCRSDGMEKIERHVDTRQYSHVVWEDPADLKEKLILRIKATYPLLKDAPA